MPRHPNTIEVPRPWENQKPLRSVLAKPTDITPDAPLPRRVAGDALIAHNNATELALDLLAERLLQVAVLTPEEYTMPALVQGAIEVGVRGAEVVHDVLVVSESPVEPSSSIATE